MSHKPASTPKLPHNADQYAPTKEPSPKGTSRRISPQPASSNSSWLPPAVLEHLTDSQKGVLHSQRELFLQQKHSLGTALTAQYVLTGQNPLSEQADLLPVSPGNAPHDADDAALPASATSPAAKVFKLLPEAEKVLLSFFALQDTVSREDAVLLARQAGCNEGQVREYFTRLRGGVRSFTLRQQRKASGKPVGSHAAPAAAGIPSSAVSAFGGNGDVAEELNTPERDAKVPVPDANLAAGAARKQAALDQLLACLDAGGGISSPDHAGTVAQLVQAGRSWTIRFALVAALAATASQAALARLTASSMMLGTLNAWLLAGVEDRQSTFLRAALRMLTRLPLSSVSLQNAGLAKTVTQLLKYRSAHVVDAAVTLLQHWGTQGGLKLASPPKATVKSAALLATPQRPETFHKRKHQMSKLREAARPLTADAVVKARLPSGGVKKLKPGGSGGAHPTSRQVASASRPAQVGDGSRQVASQAYREASQRLNVARSRQQRQEALEAERVAGSQELAVMCAAMPCRFPAPLLATAAVPCNPHTTEQIAQAAHVASEAEATYVLRSLIPDSPAEPWAPPANAAALPRVPFVPTDPEEAEQQRDASAAAGINLPHLLAEPPLPLHMGHPPGVPGHAYQPAVASTPQMHLQAPYAPQPGFAAGLPLTPSAPSSYGTYPPQAGLP